MAGKYNPFRPDKIVHPGMFAGRREEILTIDQCLIQTKAGNPRHFLIEGERGIGKSSLCLIADFVATGSVATLEKELKLSQMVVSISVSAKDDFYSIVRAIIAELNQKIRKINKFKTFVLTAWEFVSSFEAGGVKFKRDGSKPEPAELMACLVCDIENIILQMAQDLDGILILIDEADRPSADADLGLFCKMLTEQMVRRRTDRVCIGLSGLPNLIQKLRESHESAPRIFDTISLKPLEQNERIEVIYRGLKDAKNQLGVDVTIDADAAQYLANLSEGYPHFLQQFCFCAYEEDSDYNIDISDVVRSLAAQNGAFDQLGSKYFNDYYQTPYSDDYRKILDYMATHSDKWIDRATILAHSGLKKGTVDNGLRAMKARNIILQNDLRRGEYRLPTLSFAVWIKAKAEAGI
jgi:hypothetical protein